MPVLRGARLFALLMFIACPAEAQRAAWTSSIDASFRLNAALHPLTTDAGGNLFVVGYGSDGTNFNIVTVKLTPDGREAWRATLSSSESSSARAITTDPVGNVYVAASVSRPGLVGANYLIVKYSPDGSELWRRSANASPFLVASPYAITTDPTGNVYVTGGSNGSVSSTGGFTGDFFTLKYAPDGTELWRAVTDGGSNFGDVGNAIAVDAAGNVYVVGASVYNFNLFEGSYFAGELLKYDAAGALRWRAGIGGGGELGNGVDVATDAAGNVLMAATSTTGAPPLLQGALPSARQVRHAGQPIVERKGDRPVGIHG